MAITIATCIALVERITKETSVQITLSLDDGKLDLLPNDSKSPKDIPAQTTQHHASQDSLSQQIWIWTGISFLDHMIHALAKHSGWSLRVRAHSNLASQYNAFGSLASHCDTKRYPQSTIIILQKTASSPSAKPTRKHSATAKVSGAEVTGTLRSMKPLLEP